MKYTNAKQAFEDLKETFLCTIAHKDNELIEGWVQATAIQALQHMSEKELLQFANSSADPLDKMTQAHEMQVALNFKYKEKEPTLIRSLNNRLKMASLKVDLLSSHLL